MNDNLLEFFFVLYDGIIIIIFSCHFDLKYKQTNKKHIENSIELNVLTSRNVFHCLVF